MSLDGPIYQKFDVRRVDGRDAPGEKHFGCRYFVLDLTHDPYARIAALAYADACAASHPVLSIELRNRVDFEEEAADV